MKDATAAKRRERFAAVCEVFGAVPHEAYRAFGVAELAALLRPDGLVADIKGMWRSLDVSAPFFVWRP